MAEGSSTYEILLSARDETRDAFDSIKANTGSLTDKLEIARGAVAAVGIAAASAAAVMIKNSLDSADAMSKAAQKVGTTTEMLSGLKYAADLSDLSFESLQKSMGKLANNAYLAATAGGASAAAFNNLGINVKGADGHLKDSGTLLEEVAEKFAAMPDSTEKSALAIQMFGKSGLEMIPFLNSGKEGLQKLREEAARMGLVIEGDVGKQSEAFNDNLTRISKGSEGLANRMMADVVPALNEVANAYLDSTRDGGALAEAAHGVKTEFETVVIVGANVAFVFKQVGNEIGGISAQVVALAHADFKGFAAIGAAMKKDAEEARKELDAFEQRILHPPTPPQESKKGNKPHVDSEDDAKAMAAMLENARRLTAELIAAHQTAAEKISDKYEEMEAKLTASGAKGYEQRKLLRAAYDQYVAEEQAKEDEEKQKQIDKETEQNNKLIESQQEKFTRMKEQADQAAASDDEREQLRYQAQLRQLENDRKVLEDKGLYDMQSQAKYNAAIEAMQREHLVKMQQTSRTFGISMLQFEQQTNLQKTQTFASALMQMTAIGAQNNRALFEINKVASVANATISGVQAVQDSYKFGATWGGPVGGAAMAAIAVAATAANIAAIASTEFGGGGASSGGAGIPSMATAPGIPVAPQQSAPPPTPGSTAAQEPREVNIYLPAGTSPKDMYSADIVRNHIIPAINDAAGDGVTINVRTA